MASQTELMAHGMAWGLARGLGDDAPASALVATGTNQATALALTSSLNSFATVAASTGAVLPSAQNKPDYLIYNGGASALTVYPNGTATVNGATSFSVTNGKAALFRPAGLNWIAILSA